MNGCPAKANPKRKNLRQLASKLIARRPSDAAASLAARHVQAGLQGLQGGGADRRVAPAAGDARRVDSGLRKFISAVVVTFIDEDVVIDAAGNDVKFGVRDVARGELGVLRWRPL